VQPSTIGSGGYAETELLDRDGVAERKILRHDSTGIMSSGAAIGFLTFDKMEELDLVGPWEMFSAWAATGSGGDCFTVGATSDPVRCRFGLRVTPDTSIAEAPAAGVLVIPGGGGSRAAADDSGIVDFVRRTVQGGAAVLSVCTGVRVLHAAGLLEGKRVTTHHTAFDEVERWGRVDLVKGQRFVRDGEVWTSAGVTAGMDLALAAIETWSSRDEADRVRAYVEYASGADRSPDP